MPTVSRQVMIEATRDAVWATLSDIGAVSEWNPVVTHSATTDGRDTAGLGAARHCDLPGSMGAIDEVVTEWTERESMEFDIRGAKMMRAMRARFDLADAGSRTQVTMTSDFRMVLGPIGALMAATAGKRMLAGNMQQTLDGLKAHVESSIHADVAAAESPGAAVTESER